jgi:hypothetical protein
MKQFEFSARIIHFQPMKNDIENPKASESEYQRIIPIIEETETISGSNTPRPIRNVQIANPTSASTSPLDIIEVTPKEKNSRNSSVSSNGSHQHKAAKSKGKNIKNTVKNTAKKVKNTKTGKQVSSLVKDFKLFISKGSVIDLAVGIIIGSAMSEIVQSMVNDIIGPILGLLINNTLENSYFLLAW